MAGPERVLARLSVRMAPAHRPERWAHHSVFGFGWVCGCVLDELASSLFPSTPDSFLPEAFCLECSPPALHSWLLPVI